MKNPHAKVWVLAGNGRQKHGLDFHYKIPKSGTWLILAPVWHQELSSKSKSQLQGFAMKSEIEQVWVLLSLMGDLSLPIKNVMLKKSHFPSLKLLSLQLENEQGKFCPFLPLLKFGKQRQTQMNVFFWSLWPNICSHMVFPRLRKAEIQFHFWLELSGKSSALPIHSWIIIGNSKPCSNLTSICQLINSLPMGKK